MEIMLDHVDVLYNSLLTVAWPASFGNGENDFNKKYLSTILARAVSPHTIQTVAPDAFRRPDATPFFGWGALKKNPNRLTKRVGTDLTFVFHDLRFFVETKIVPLPGKGEANIKNSLVQAIEYFNVYDVHVGLVLVFDNGRAVSREWDNHSEEKIIRILTENYPLWIVRVRPNLTTKIYRGGYRNE